MANELNRDDLVALLNKLGSTDDAEVLASARELNRTVNAAGASWDALLQGDDRDDDVAHEPSANDDNVLVAPNADHGALTDEDKVEARALIDALGKLEISDTTRDELTDYAADLVAGRMEKMDLRYLRALNKRLTGK